MVTRHCREHVFGKAYSLFAYLSWQSILTVLHTCGSIILKCIRTRFCKGLNSEWLSAHLDETISLATVTLFQFKYLEVLSN